MSHVRTHRHWLRRTALVGTGLLAAAVLAAGPALAEPAPGLPTLGVTATTATRVEAGGSVALAGMTITQGGDSELVNAVVATTQGTLSFDTSVASVTLGTGDTATGDTSVTVSGTKAAVNLVLATAALVVAGDATGTADVTVIAYGGTAITYNEGNGHFYEAVVRADGEPNLSWDGAKAAAELRTFYGWQGYLATITDAAENTVVAERIEGAKKVWIGGKATVVGSGPTGTRTFTWETGPEAGTAFWRCLTAAVAFSCRGDYAEPLGFASWTPPGSPDDLPSTGSGEPNNASGGNENYVLTNWVRLVGQEEVLLPGLWNDKKGDASDVHGNYVVEYGGMVGDQGGPPKAVTAIAIVPPSVPVVEAAPTLPLTGSDGAVPLGVLAGVVLLTGAAVVLARRRSLA